MLCCTTRHLCQKHKPRKHQTKADVNALCKSFHTMTPSTRRNLLRPLNIVCVARSSIRLSQSILRIHFWDSTFGLLRRITRSVGLRVHPSGHTRQDVFSSKFTSYLFRFFLLHTNLFEFLHHDKHSRFHHSFHRSLTSPALAFHHWRPFDPKYFFPAHLPCAAIRTEYPNSQC